jgi:hypothetical protein
MTMQSLLLVVLFTGGLQANEPIQPAATADAEVLAVVDRFFVAFAANDFATMAKCESKGASTSSMVRARRAERD